MVLTFNFLSIIFIFILETVALLLRKINSLEEKIYFIVKEVKDIKKDGKSKRMQNVNCSGIICLIIFIFCSHFYQLITDLPQGIILPIESHIQWDNLESILSDDEQRKQMV